MIEAVEPLRLLMERTDQVRIVGNGTDLTFSIKGIPAVPCCGEMNIPDGEIYTAPVRDSVNGVLCYNTPSQYQGFVYENICLTFENGKIVNAEANDTRRINKVFDTDEGARYVGEFAIGINPYVLTPMKDTLFDETIMGSFHFTPGNCYDEAPNGNSSAIHWDLVCIQTPEWGGGEIWFDGVLVRKDGRFVLPELQGLNPEELKKSNRGVLLRVLCEAADSLSLAEFCFCEFPWRRLTDCRLVWIPYDKYTRNRQRIGTGLFTQRRTGF